MSNVSRIWAAVFCGALFGAGSLVASEFPLLGFRPLQSAEDVTVLVQVQDRLGRYVSGLEKEEFMLWEDKIEQNISFFQPVPFPSAPVKTAYAIVFDVSGSSTPSDEVRQTIAQFLNTADPGDQFSLISFNGVPSVSMGFTEDRNAIQRGLSSATVSSPAALLDGIQLAADTLRSSNLLYKVVVVVTDGSGRAGAYTRERAQMIAGATPGPILVFSASSDEVLDELVTRTNGRQIRPSQIDELTKFRVGLRNSYVLRFKPANGAHDGSYRQIRIKVQPPHGIAGLNVLSPAGYNAPSR